MVKTPCFLCPGNGFYLWSSVTTSVLPPFWGWWTSGGDSELRVWGVFLGMEEETGVAQAAGSWGALVFEAAPFPGEGVLK